MLLVAITLGGFLGAFTVSATNIALPMIESEFHVSALTLSWIPLAYVLATAAALMPMGRIADLHGHKRSLIWSLRVFAALLLATAFAPSAGWLIGLRAAQGIAGAMVIPASTAIVTFAYPLESARQSARTVRLGSLSRLHSWPGARRSRHPQHRMANPLPDGRGARGGQLSHTALETA